MEQIKQFFFNIYFAIRVYRRGFKLRRQDYSLFKPRKAIKRRTVIAMLDYKNQRIGLSDRLRGAIFTYNCVKELRAEGEDIDFKIDFNVPFELSQYLVPATYDWQIESSEISYNTSQVEIIKFGTRGNNREHWDYLKRRIKRSRHNQIHVYSNRYDQREGAFSTSFKELFKPSPRIEEILDFHTTSLHAECGYINTTLRFQNLLGDFTEGDRRIPLESEELKEELIQKCMAQIEKIHLENRDKMILVTSDSRRFLDIAAQKQYVYTIDGELVHMAFTKESSFEMHQKAFVDYLMIAGAERVYLLRTGKMFDSGFPQTAAIINNRPFQKIQF